jgi:acetyl esterase/lipase
MSLFLNKIKQIVLGLLCLNLIACDDIGLWAINSLASFSEQQLIEDISYGEHVLNKLDLYRPLIKNKQTKPLATLVFIYGGCWGGCKTIRKENYRFVAESLTKLGYLVVIPDYRHYPEVGFQKL